MTITENYYKTDKKYQNISENSDEYISRNTENSSKTPENISFSDIPQNNECISENNQNIPDFLSNFSDFSAKNELSADKTLSAFILGMPSFFRALNYQVDDSFPADFFKFYPLFCSDSAPDFLNLEDYISPILIKTKDDFLSFHDDYISYVKSYKKEFTGLSENNKKKLSNIESAFRSSQKEKDSLEKQEKTLEKDVELEKQQKGKKLTTDKKLKEFNTLFQKNKKEYEKLFSQDSLYKQFLEIEEIVSGKRKDFTDYKDPETIEEHLKSQLPKVLKSKNSMDLMKIIKMQKDFLKIIKKRMDERKISAEQKLKNLLENKKQVEKNLENLKEKFKQETLKIAQENKQATVEKEESVNHRETFKKENNRSVQSSALGEAILNKEFNLLSEREKKMIYDYIRDNARKFRTRVSRNVRTSMRHIIDIPNTCKNACATLGIPLKLNFLKPKRQKTKLVMFLDISGSCRDASELMLTFMSQMKEVFPGGCQTFVFVNSLYDISEIFENSFTNDEAVKQVLNTIPTRGVYSNYNEPFKEFYETRMHELTKDSIVFFIGDARNNSFPTGEEYVKAICRRARKAYWLNTEDESQWDYKDSIFSIYKQYVTQYTECINTSQLLNFLISTR